MNDICGAPLKFGDKVFIVMNDYKSTRDINSLFLDDKLCKNYFGIIVGENQIFTSLIKSGKVNKTYIMNHSLVIKIIECDTLLDNYFNQLYLEYEHIIENKIKFRLKPGDIFMATNNKKYVYLGNLLVEYMYKNKIIDSGIGDYCVCLYDLKNVYSGSGNFYLDKIDLQEYYKQIFEGGCKLINMDSSSILVKNIYNTLNLLNICANMSIHNNKNKSYRLVISSND